MDEERIDRALDALLSDRSPREYLAGLGEHEQLMVQAAQMLRGSRPPPPDPCFVDQLRERVQPTVRRMSRRAAVVAGAGSLAAGIAAGIGLDRAARTEPPPALGQEHLVADRGQWFHVANLHDLPDGSVQTFSVGAVQGFLIHRHGQVRALSRICTHMGCALQYKGAESTLECPCHGAEFDLHGKLRYGPGKRYGHQLAPLPAIPVRLQGTSVQVFAV